MAKYKYGDKVLYKGEVHTFLRYSASTPKECRLVINNNNDPMYDGRCIGYTDGESYLIPTSAIKLVGIFLGGE